MRVLDRTIVALGSHPADAGVGITLTGVVVLALLTPRIDFNDGLGNDGTAYANLTEALRGKAAEPQWAAFAYRLLPSAIVAAMPFDVITGFLVVNVVSILGSALLLLRLLDRYGVPSRLALLRLLWWIPLADGRALGHLLPGARRCLRLFSSSSRSSSARSSAASSSSRSRWAPA